MPFPAEEIKWKVSTKVNPTREAKVKTTVRAMWVKSMTEPDKSPPEQVDLRGGPRKSSPTKNSKGGRPPDTAHNGPTHGRDTKNAATEEVQQCSNRRKHNEVSAPTREEEPPTIVALQEKNREMEGLRWLSGERRFTPTLGQLRREGPPNFTPLRG